MARGRNTRSSGKKSSAKTRRPTSKVDEDTRSMEECFESIEYHWEGFKPQVKRFLLQDPSELSLSKFLKFFSQPDQIALTHISVSAGTAHTLAYEYLRVGAYENAKALTLCGAFFKQTQCVNTPFDKMLTMPIKDERNPTELPLYYQGVQAVKDEISNSCYLKRALQLKYQRIMGIESHNQVTPGKQYTDLIANDWNGKSNSKKSKHQQEKNDNTEITIVLSNRDDATEHNQNIKMDATLKSLFNGYADLCGVSLRSLRFAYNGSTLFLSSIGQKTPLDMGMKHMDTIIVFNIEMSNKTKKEEPASLTRVRKKKGSAKSHKAGKGKQHRKSATAIHQPISVPGLNSERDKVAHSNLLSKVFEEMSPQLKIIRQQLNDMVLERQSSKTKKSSTRKKISTEAPNTMTNPSAVGIGGKAGRTSFAINVGRVENLYKTSKQRNCALARPSQAEIDLHGCTQEEALGKLGAILTTWIDTAMHGSYPWVIPAVIVCGGGNQILSGTVEGWIKQTKGVANAPKRSVLWR